MEHVISQKIAHKNQDKNNYKKSRQVEVAIGFFHSKRFDWPFQTALTLSTQDQVLHRIAAAPGRRDGVRRHDPLRWPCAPCLHWLRDGVPTRPARSSSPTSPMWGSSPTRAPWRWSRAPQARSSSPPPAKTISCLPI